MRSTGLNAMPSSIKKELGKLGDDIRKARIRRKLTMKELSSRAFISENTLSSVQKGKASVAIGIYARILSILGINGQIAMLADISSDPISQELEAESLPKRVVK